MSGCVCACLTPSKGALYAAEPGKSRGKGRAALGPTGRAALGPRRSGCGLRAGPHAADLQARVRVVDMAVNGCEWL